MSVRQIWHLSVFTGWGKRWAKVIFPGFLQKKKTKQKKNKTGGGFTQFVRFVFNLTSRRCEREKTLAANFLCVFLPSSTDTQQTTGVHVTGKRTPVINSCVLEMVLSPASPGSALSQRTITGFWRRQRQRQRQRGHRERERGEGVPSLLRHGIIISRQL